MTRDTMVNARIGDLFESSARTLVNTVNCVGAMGKGIAQIFRKRFPGMYADYLVRCEAGKVRLGEPYLYQDLAGASIINFPTKDHWRAPTRIADIERGLDYLVEHSREWGLTTLAMPALGCGNGGLEWSEVGPLIVRKLDDAPFDVELYAPYGTPRTQLTREFLTAPAQAELSGRGRSAAKMNPAWIVLLEVLRGLEEQPFAAPVGRTIFQKLCYVVTEMGVPTEFDFGKGAFGPYSADVQRALQEFANRNWIVEKQLGRMTAVRIGPEYEKDRSGWSDDIAQYRGKIAKAVDLFSRIKSTTQAEEVMTVLFASRQLKRTRPDQPVSEEDLFKYILDWKESWQSDEKRAALATAIRSLVLLGWMRLEPSASLDKLNALGADEVA